MAGYTRKTSVKGVAKTTRPKIGRKAKRRARGICPVDTGHLMRNINYDVRGDTLRLGDLFNRVVYMRHQELTHKTKRYFLRRGLKSVQRDIKRAQRRSRIRGLRRTLTLSRQQREARL